MNQTTASIALKAQLTSKDLRDLWSGSRFKYLSWLIVPFGLYLAYFVFAVIVNEGFSIGATLKVAVYAPFALAGLLAPLLIPRLCARHLISRGPTLAEPRQYSFSQRGVHFDGELMTCDFRWNAFYNIVESHRSFLLYVSPTTGIVIPKNAVPSEDDASLFRTILRANARGKLKLRS